tara:strand:- start:47 stop:325 length:279 start_codon:yes stop_codon:yes gene_type:complete
MIYIATNEHGRGIKHITAFDDRMDFLRYADVVLAWYDNASLIRAKSTPIDTICEALYDKGIGFGARDHRRVSRQEAKEYIREGAKAVGCWNL